MPSSRHGLVICAEPRLDVHCERGALLPHWQEAIFAAMMRNSSHVTDYFRLPGEQVVEIGRQISI